MADLEFEWLTLQRFDDRTGKLRVIARRAFIVGNLASEARARRWLEIDADTAGRGTYVFGGTRIFPDLTKK